MGKSIANANLTEKENLFVLSYLANGFKGSQAVIEAGYSDKNASAMASKLLKKPKIQKEIAKQLRERNDEKIIEQEDVLVNLFYAVTRTGADFVDEDGIVYDSVLDMNPRAQACIDAIKQKVTVLTDPETGEEIGKRVETEVKMTPKLQALKLAMEHKGMFPPRNVNHTGEIDHKHHIDWDKALAHTERDEEDILEGVVVNGELPALTFIENEAEEEILYEKPE